MRADGREIDWPVPYWHMYIGCAVMVVVLAAMDEGLAAAFARAFDLTALRALLNIPAEVMLVVVIAIGHGAPNKPSPSLKRGRRPRAEVVREEACRAARTGSALQTAPVRRTLAVPSSLRG